MFQASCDFIVAGATESQRKGIKLFEVECRVHQTIWSPAMPYPKKMRCFVQADLGGSQIHAPGVLVPEPIKGDHGGLAAKLGFAEHELENRCADVALNDPQFEPGAASHRFERIKDLARRILATEGKVGRFRVWEGRQNLGIEAHDRLQVCGHNGNRSGIHPPQRNQVQMAVIG